MESMSDSNNSSMNDLKKIKGRSVVLTTISGVVSAGVQTDITAEGQGTVILTILVSSGNYRGMYIGLVGYDDHAQTLTVFRPGQKVSATGIMAIYDSDYRLTIYSARAEE